MAITGPKSDQSIGYVSNQFNDRLRLLLAELQNTIAEEQKKKEDITGSILFTLGGLKQIKDYRDEFLKDKYDETIFAGQVGEKVMKKYATAPPKERELFKGKYLQKAKDFIYEPDLVLNPQLKDAPLPFIDGKERNEAQKFKYLRNQGFSVEEAAKTLDIDLDKITNEAAQMQLNSMEKGGKTLYNTRTRAREITPNEYGGYSSKLLMTIPADDKSERFYLGEGQSRSRSLVN